MAIECPPCFPATKQTRPSILRSASKQRTLKTPVSLSGIGLFTGEKSSLTLRPAPAGTGISFLRTDVKKERRGLLPARLHNVVGTPRCTVLGNSSYTIHTVEHLLSALKGCRIDNVLIEITGPEVPILDGSAAPFVEAIEHAETVEQEIDIVTHILKTPLSFSRQDIHLIAIPSSELRFSYTLHFPESKMLHAQYFSTVLTPEIFSTQIAPSRTFCIYEEIAPFIEQGLIKGGGLENAVIIKNEGIVNPEGLRFDDEMVRHKVLDLIGDLSLLPCDLLAHIIAIRSGHASNVAFAKDLLAHITREKADDL